MSTATEVAEVVDWLESCWPGTRNYRDVEALYALFSGIPAKALWIAARQYFDAGNRLAPGLSELKASAVRIAAERGLRDPQATNCSLRGHHGHLAITDTGPGTREAECLDCGTIWRKPAAELPTNAERDAGARAPKLDASPADDDLTDRIAP